MDFKVAGRRKNNRNHVKRRCHVCRYFRRLYCLTVRRLSLVTFGRPRRVFEVLFDHLNADYREHRIDPASIKHQSDAYVLEISSLEHMSTVQLVARIQALRHNLRDMLVADEYNELMSRMADVVPAGHTSLTLLRWEARALLDRVYRRYALVPRVEQERSRIMLRLVALMLGLLTPLSMVILVYALSTNSWFGAASVAYVGSAMAGSVGATVSTLIRLYKVDPRRDPLMLWLSLKRGGYSLLLAPFLGALFGFLFLLLMKTGVVAGSLFPDFNRDDWGTAAMLMDSGRCRGSGVCLGLFSDYEGILLWSFAAGWIERLVPDVLNRMSDYTHTQTRLNSEDSK